MSKTPLEKRPVAELRAICKEKNIPVCQGSKYIKKSELIKILKIKTKVTHEPKPITKQRCLSGKIINPHTGRCIKQDGPTAKRLGLKPLTKPKVPISKKQCLPGQIINPHTGRCIKQDGPTAKRFGLKPLAKTVKKMPLQK